MDLWPSSQLSGDLPFLSLYFMVVLSLQKVNSDKFDASHTGKHLNKGAYYNLYWFFVVLSVKVKHANIFVVIREGNEFASHF